MKRAQVAETATWIVATVIILIILIVSVFVASFIPKSVSTFTGNTDLFAHQSLVSYLLTADSSGSSVYSGFNQRGDFNDFSGNLAADIFGTFYSWQYNAIFLGFLSNPSSNVIARSNQYFDKSANPSLKAGDNIRGISPENAALASSPNGAYVIYQIYLDNGNIIKAVLRHIK